MKKFNFIFFTILSIGFILSASCKKSKPEKADESTSVFTQKVLFVRSETIYGGDYTFGVRFEEIGDISEYGIVYKAWINDTNNKVPMIGSAGCHTIIFGDTPGSRGVPITKKISIAFKDFNDANYRAYAILKSGDIVYGDIIYFVSA